MRKPRNHSARTLQVNAAHYARLKARAAALRSPEHGLPAAVSGVRFGHPAPTAGAAARHTAADAWAATPAAQALPEDVRAWLAARYVAVGVEPVEALALIVRAFMEYEHQLAQRDPRARW